MVLGLKPGMERLHCLPRPRGAPVGADPGAERCSVTRWPLGVPERPRIATDAQTVPGPWSHARADVSKPLPRAVRASGCAMRTTAAHGGCWFVQRSSTPRAGPMLGPHTRRGHRRVRC
jgi:hypothetical protein